MPEIAKGTSDQTQTQPAQDVTVKSVSPNWGENAKSRNASGNDNAMTMRAANIVISEMLNSFSIARLIKLIRIPPTGVTFGLGIYAPAIREQSPNASNKRRPDKGVRWRPQAGTNLIDLLKLIRSSPSASRFVPPPVKRCHGRSLLLGYSMTMIYGS